MYPDAKSLMIPFSTILIFLLKGKCTSKVIRTVIGSEVLFSGSMNLKSKCDSEVYVPAFSSKTVF